MVQTTFNEFSPSRATCTNMHAHTTYHIITLLRAACRPNRGSTCDPRAQNICWHVAKSTAHTARMKLLLRFHLPQNASSSAKSANAQKPVARDRRPHEIRNGHCTDGQALYQRDGCYLWHYSSDRHVLWLSSSLVTPTTPLCCTSIRPSVAARARENYDTAIREITT